MGKLDEKNCGNFTEKMKTTVACFNRLHVKSWCDVDYSAEREKEIDKDIEREKLCVCVCMCVCAGMTDLRRIKRRGRSKK